MLLQEITIVICQGVDWNGKCPDFTRKVGFRRILVREKGVGQRKRKWAEMVGKPEGMVVDGSTRFTRLVDSAHPTSYYIQSDCARLLGKGLDKFAVNRLSFVGFLQADISKGAPRETYISASQS